MLNQNDRIQFSLKIVSAEESIVGLTQAQQALAAPLDTAQKLDEGNKRLFDPVNSLVQNYHRELELLDGLQKTNITEQDLLDSANRVIGNHFYPNNTNISVPSLSSSFNVWTKTYPYARTFAVGKNYQESNTVIQKEFDLLNSIASIIASINLNSDMENTTGQYLLTIPGPPSSTVIAPYPTVINQKNNLVAEVSSLLSFVLNEENQIVTNDKNLSRQALNDIAIANIIALQNDLNQWLSYPDFHYPATPPLPTITVGNFNSYNASLLAPTKLHSAQLSALLSTINNRISYLNTRLSELSTFLGVLTQDLTTGQITFSSGLYGLRYEYLNLRLNLFTGSLIEVINITSSIGAQETIKNSLNEQKNSYSNIIPTSLLKAPASNTDKISVLNPSIFNIGDQVYICAENQPELNRAVKDKIGDLIVLNDVVPSKYRPNDKARMYKDIS